MSSTDVNAMFQPYDPGVEDDTIFALVVNQGFSALTVHDCSPKQGSDCIM